MMNPRAVRSETDGTGGGLGVYPGSSALIRGVLDAPKELPLPCAAWAE
jgi:hypothetical protein